MAFAISLTLLFFILMVESFDRSMTCVEINQCVGCTDNSSLSHFSAMTRPSWLGRAARNRHRHAIEQTSRRWRGGRRGDSARTRRKILISAQVPSYVAYQQTPLQTFW